MDEVAPFIEARRVGLAAHENGTLVERDGWLQLTTPDAPTPYRNGIYRCVVGPDAVDATIEEALAHYAEVGVPFCWSVTPACRPVDLGARLLARGFTHANSVCAMRIDPAAFEGAAPGDVTVEPVGPGTVDDWVHAVGAGWGMPEAGRNRFRAEAHASFEEEPQRLLHYVARIAGKPVGAASMRLFTASAHLTGGVVIEEARRRGVYRALLAERMRGLVARGLGVATAYCVSTTSAPICRSLGFQDVYQEEDYLFGV